MLKITPAVLGWALLASLCISLGNGFWLTLHQYPVDDLAALCQRPAYMSHRVTGVYEPVDDRRIRATRKGKSLTGISGI